MTHHISTAGPSQIPMPVTSNAADITTDRRVLRNKLDGESDLVVIDSKVAFRQTFETIELAETYSRAPHQIIEAARNILSAERLVSVTGTVRDTIFFTIGCNRVPLFANVSGGRGRTLFEFQCVFGGCSAFLVIRMFSGIDAVKWVVIGVSHSHSFTAFPPRMPRNTFPEEVLDKIRGMAAEKVNTTEIKLKNGVLCNRDVFQNALRSVRKELSTDQCRDLRNTVSSSHLWSSVIHLSSDNVFVEAFFTNTALASKCLNIEFVYLDDTSCTNSFCLPLMTILSRDASSRIHTIAWGIIKNRTTATFRRFFLFVKKTYPSLNVFMCDRHFAQRRAIKDVFGESVSVLHCCVHLARNMKSNCGANSDLVSKFWEMRYRRTKEAEEAFVLTLQRLHEVGKSLFTTELLNSLPSFIPSQVDQVIKKELFPALTVLRNLSKKYTIVDTAANGIVLLLFKGHVEVGPIESDLFTLDNTNVIEGYFNGIKTRIQKQSSDTS